MTLDPARQRLGAFLRARREEIGLTQADISKRLGFKSPQFVSNWERGKSTPPVDCAPKLAKLLKISKGDYLNAFSDYLEDVAEARYRALKRVLGVGK